jgi:methanogenic corrinoid protein MtbC1
MPNDRQVSIAPQTGGHDHQRLVSLLADKVVVAAVDRLSRADSVMELSENYVTALVAATIHRDAEELRQIFSEMRKDGIPVDLICEAYIPQVARVLGDRWCDDSLGFAEVTIGTARLQGHLRDLHRATSRHGADHDLDAPHVLLCVPDGEFHTLGAVVLAGQMRRRGVCVQLKIGQAEDEILSLVATNSYDLVMFSVSNVENLPILSQTLRKIRGRVGPNLPIVVGGLIADVVKGDADAFGVDIATSDLDEAFDYCGVNFPDTGNVLVKTKA